MALLEISHVFKTYDHEPTIEDLSLSVAQGEILGVLGPSGSGKTTLLRIIAGLERADAGKIFFDGKDITSIPSYRRHFGMMFQEYALFPHEDVFENVAFGLRMQKMAMPQIRMRIEEMLVLVGLTGFGSRNVAELSGGERQRVALARSLAPYPRLLMLDEPFGSLDRPLREQLMTDVRRILKGLQITSLFVTHDQTEALAVADVIAVTQKGRIEQVDRPEVIHRYPANAFVASFLGLNNLLSGTLLPDGRVETPIGILNPELTDKRSGEAVTVLVRPEAARLITDECEVDAGETVLCGMVVDRLFRGVLYRLEIDTRSGQTLVFDLPGETPPPQNGERIRLAIRPSAVVLIA